MVAKVNKAHYAVMRCRDRKQGRQNLLESLHMRAACKVTAWSKRYGSDQVPPMWKCSLDFSRLRANHYISDNKDARTLRFASRTTRELFYLAQRTYVGEAWTNFRAQCHKN